MNKRKRTSPIWTIEKQELEKLVDQCSTMTEVLNYFGLKNKGGNHRTLKNRLEYEDIDVIEMTLQEVLSTRFQDAKTIIGINYVKSNLDKFK